MVFKNGCCCPQHAEWGYGTVDPKQLFRLTYPEERFCGVGRCSSFGHKGRIRKICVFCRERIRLQKRCETLEVKLQVIVCEKFARGKIYSVSKSYIMLHLLTSLSFGFCCFFRLLHRATKKNFVTIP